MQNLATLPTQVPALQQLVLEQQQMIQTMQAQLHHALKRQFGPRSEQVDVDQFGLFPADTSQVIEIPPTEEGEAPPASKDSAGTPRKKALRILKDLPREVRVIDLPESEKTCAC